MSLLPHFIDGSTVINATTINPIIDAVNAGGGGAGSAPLSYTVAQTAHGFTVGQVVRFSGTTYSLARADQAANCAGLVGIVSEVIDVNTFVVAEGGHVTGLSALTEGTTYYLSATAAGALVNTAPSTAGQFVVPLLVADSTTSGVVLPPAQAVVPTVPLPVAQGGTGANTAAGALSSLGAAPLASPALTGTPTAPTAPAATDTTQIATCAFVEGEVSTAESTIATELATAWGDIYGATGGGVVAGCMIAQQATPNMSVSVATGYYYRAGVRRSCAGSSALTIGANSSGVSRYDLVIIDSTDILTVVTGTPAANAVVPVAPAGSVVVGNVLVVNGAASITTANITPGPFAFTWSSVNDHAQWNPDWVGGLGWGTMPPFHPSAPIYADLALNVNDVAAWISDITGVAYGSPLPSNGVLSPANLANIAAAVAALQENVDHFIGDGVTTIFTLSQTATSAPYKVFRQGVYQYEGAGNDYTRTTAQVTFNSAPPAGNLIDVWYHT